ncbi:MAG: hypothetical protein ACU843_07790 [Gammaproteobacteria bacterium]
MPNRNGPAGADSLSRIDYALSKQIPDIGQRAVICTNYGELELYEHDAILISRVAQSILERQRSILLQSGGK